MTFPRHRVVHSTSLDLLQIQVEELKKDGWQTFGEPALAKPATGGTNYWAQALYKAAGSIPLEVRPAPKDDVGRRAP